MRIHRPGPKPSTSKSSKSSKAGGKKFSARLGKIDKVDQVDQVDQVSGDGKSSLEDAFAQIAEDLHQGKHETLEDATHAFVQVVLRERWKFLNPAEKGVDKMERYISKSMSDDPKMAERLQLQFKRYARIRAGQGA